MQHTLINSHVVPVSEKHKPNRALAKAKGMPEPQNNYMDVFLPTVEIEGVRYTLTLKQTLFANKYIENGFDATEAYKASYGASGLNPNVSESSFRVRGYQVMHHPAVQLYLGQLLTALGFNDVFVRGQHLKVISQDKQLNAKNKAIDMYYKLKGDYAPTKKEVTTKYEGMPEERKQYIDALFEIDHVSNERPVEQTRQEIPN